MPQRFIPRTVIEEALMAEDPWVVLDRWVATLPAGEAWRGEAARRPKGWGWDPDLWLRESHEVDWPLTRRDGCHQLGHIKTARKLLDKIQWGSHPSRDAQPGCSRSSADFRRSI